MNYFRFLRLLIVFTALLSLVAGILSFTLPEKYFAPQIWMILIYFLSISALFQLTLAHNTGENGQKYVRAFMAGTTIKLFIHVVVLLVFAFMNREKAIPIIITFFCCYLLFTIFEVTMQLRKSKPQKI
ncbi:MAG: hypothetical protein JJE25_13830 [Bacteroidia bacterium]|nr:hypothetical protein [Bacteroidia bacterium]